MRTAQLAERGRGHDHDRGHAGAPRPGVWSSRPRPARPPYSAHAPTTAPIAKVPQATSTAPVPSTFRREPSVSTIENPQGDHVPVIPASSAVSPGPGSARDPRLIVLNAEDLAAGVAV